MRAIPNAAVTFIKKHEGCVLRVYDDKHPSRILKPGDPVEGVLTAGWGHTGSDLKIGMTVTKAMAEAWLKDDLTRKAALPLKAKIGAVVDLLTDNQYAALLSFVFNLGTGNPKKKEWTIWKLLRAKHFAQVPAEMALFVNWNGKKSQGLVNRRNFEIALWSKDEPGAVAIDPPSSVTRREETAPTASDPVPPQKSATFISAALGTAATVPVAATQVTQAIEPYKDSSPLVGQMVAGVATLAAIAAIIVLVLTWLNKRKARG